LFDKHGQIVGASAPNAMEKMYAYDNVESFFQTGVTYNNSLSMTGGNEVSSFFMSLSQMKSNGVVPNNEYEKYTVKLTGNTKLSDQFTFSGSANYIKSGGNRIQQGSNISGVMLGLLRTPPSFDNANGYDDPVNTPEAYLFPDGSQRSYRWGIYDNPFWTVNRNGFRDDVNRIMGYASVVYTPLSWLNITYRLGNDFYMDRRKGFFAINSAQYPGGQVMEDHHANWDFNADLLVNIKKDITNDFAINVNLGNNMFQHYHQQIFTQGDNLSQPDFYNISNASSVINKEIIKKKRTAAFFGDIGLAYKRMLYLNVTGRNEWSTTMPVDKNSFFFPSASIGFVFTELPFLVDNQVLSFGKIRTSYAIVANDADEYATLSYWAAGFYNDGWTNGITFPFMGLTGFMTDDLMGNPILKPEKMKSFEIGTDLRFLQNRLGIDFTYFSNRNEDLIIQVPLAGTSGFTAQTMNAATMTNKGVEIVLNGTPVKTESWKWDITVNFSKIKNMVMSLAEGIQNVNLGGWTGSDIRAVAGMPYATIYGTQWVKDASGNVIYDDRDLVNGEINTNKGFPFQADEEGPIGHVLPDWTGGFNSSLSYKGFNFSFLFDVRVGGQMYNGTKGALYSMGTHKDTEDRGTTTVFDGVKGHPETAEDGTTVWVTSGTNDISVVKDENWYNGLGGGFAGPTEQFIEDADWIRLRELSLGYSFDKKLFKNTFIKGLDIIFTGKNLWLSTPYSGIDPESNTFGAYNAQGLDFNMPNTRSYAATLRLSL
jgi:TonB-linked SusC/RagA family outer membrane protein